MISSWIPLYLYSYSWDKAYDVFSLIKIIILIDAQIISHGKRETIQLAEESFYYLYFILLAAYLGSCVSSIWILEILNIN